MTDSAISYNEPSTTQTLKLVLFILSLNLVNHVLDKWIYCGLVGQILIGTALGTPGADLFGVRLEESILQLGYLGLILLVYEGGLSTSIGALKDNIFMSIAVALTGISLPIGISFILIKLCSATPLQAFAAGAALCSTSLGTTFTVLESTGLTTTRLGTILMNAAMLDDVVGLIMIRIISNLGNSGSISAITVVRPIIVSVFLVAFLLPWCKFVILPLKKSLIGNPQIRTFAKLKSVCSLKYSAFVIHTSLIIGMVAAASYAGTSPLLAAYLTGAVISWWDDECPDQPSATDVDLTTLSLQTRSSPTPIHGQKDTGSSSSPLQNPNTSRPVSNPNDTERGKASSGKATYEAYYSQPVSHLLKPFFFASIGFCIPISSLFHPQTLWRGLVYAVLMLLAKLATGIWIVQFGTSFQRNTRKAPYLGNTGSQSHTMTRNPRKDTFSKENLLPPLILGSAMVARGEIGFLIASLAEDRGVFDSSRHEIDRQASSSIYLIVTWAIVLCTVLGPLSVGILVKMTNINTADRKRMARDSCTAADGQERS